MNEEAQDEALALRHVLALDGDARLDAIETLNGAALHLVNLAKAVAKELREKPNLGRDDVLAMLDRPTLKADAEHARAVLAGGVDPAAAGAAFDRVKGKAAETSERRRIDDARAYLNKAEAADDKNDRREHLRQAYENLAPARPRDREGLADVWNHHREFMFSKAAAGPRDAILLDANARPGWGKWFNSWLGPRGGLEAGRTLLLGGGPGAGKTSIAAALAVDAMAETCPVLFWQLELSRSETIEHLMGQLPAADDWWKKPYRTRANVDFPEQWAGLLEIPRNDGDLKANEAETIRDALRDLARRAERRRQAGTIRHACNGLVIVDYCQLLTVASKGPRDAGHEVLTTAASMLAKAAAEADACLVLLSQTTKQGRDGGTMSDTVYSGADLARMAHAAAVISKDEDDARNIHFNKDRGRLGTPDRDRKLEYLHRALVDHADAGGTEPDY